MIIFIVIKNGSNILPYNFCGELHTNDSRKMISGLMKVNTILKLHRYVHSQIALAKLMHVRNDGPKYFIISYAEQAPRYY